MTVTTQLVKQDDLAHLLRLTIAPDDPYTILIIASASQAVRDAEGGNPAWVRKGVPEDVLSDGQVEAPASACDVALWVATRAWNNPLNLARRTSGPISESFFENGAYGTALTDDERARIRRLNPGTSSGGLWTQPVGAGKRRQPILLPDDLAGGDALLYADDRWRWAFE